MSEDDFLATLSYPLLKFLPTGMGLPKPDPVDKADVLEMLLMPMILPLAVRDWTAAMRKLELSRLKQCTISRIEHWKRQRAAEHEFLLLEFICVGLSKTYKRYARVERDIQSSPNGSSLRRSSTSMRLKFGGKVAAEDTIIISPEPFSDEDSYSVFHLDFPSGNNPNVADLSALLEVMIDVAPKYHLYTYMCYWFARMVFDGLGFGFKGRMLEGEKARFRGKFAHKFNIINKDGRFILSRFLYLGKLFGNASEEEVEQGQDDEFVVTVPGLPVVPDIEIGNAPYSTAQKILDRFHKKRDIVYAAMTQAEEYRRLEREATEAEKQREKNEVERRIAEERKRAEDAERLHQESQRREQGAAEELQRAAQREALAVQRERVAQEEIRRLTALLEKSSMR